MSPFHAHLLDDRQSLHLSGSGVDLVVRAAGASDEVSKAYRQVWMWFQDVLPKLDADRESVRSSGGHPVRLDTAVGCRMREAAAPFAGSFATPLAAFGGALADETIAVLTENRRLNRAHADIDGDVAIYLREGHTFSFGIMDDPLADIAWARIAVSWSAPVRGIGRCVRREGHAQAGHYGLGIADSVTVLAADAATADIAATLIADAVDLPDHPAVRRMPARDLDPGSDLGDRPVTVKVGALNEAEVMQALDRGLAVAEEFRRRNLITAAALFLRGAFRFSGHGSLFRPGNDVAADRPGTFEKA